MKIRTTLELQDSLQKDLSWRKREFSTLSLLIKGNHPRSHEKKVLLRAAIVLLYSHWEGHIKHCALAYLNFLNNKGVPFNRLKPNFHLLTVSDKFRKGFSFNKFDSLIELKSYLENIPNINFKVDENLVIDTDSNLKSNILLNILKQLGFDTNGYELKAHFIDSTLVRCRNSIAHGEILSNTDIEDTYNEIEKELLGMITQFQNLILNATTTKDYLCGNVVN